MVSTDRTPSEIELLHAIAGRFKTYSQDQIAFLRYAKTKRQREEILTVSKIWEDAANELREIAAE